jgi:4,5-dihydroxyphthalate decarboxylase
VELVALFGAARANEHRVAAGNARAHVPQIIDQFEFCKNAAAECNSFAESAHVGCIVVNVHRSSDCQLRRVKSPFMALSVTLIASALTEPILAGTVADPALDLDLSTASVDENSRAMIAGRYDIAEMSMATYVQARAHGAALLALPVFMGRRFLQPCVAFAQGAHIASPHDLRGKRVALPQFWMTSSMWHRGLLVHEYGVAANEIEWVTTQPERLDVGFSPGVSVTQLDDRPLPALLHDGSVDAIFSPRPPARDVAWADWSADPFAVVDDPSVGIEYRNRTGIYPLLHTIVVREAVVRANPGLADALFALFVRSRDRAFAHPGATEIESPIAGLDFEEARAVLGDPYPYGREANAAAIRAFLTYAAEQALTPAPLAIDDAFLALD